MAALASFSLCGKCTSPCCPSPPPSAVASPLNNSVSFAAFRSVEKLSISACNASKSRVFAVTSDDEWGEERPKPHDESVVGTVASAEKSEDDEGSNIAELKRALVDSLSGTDRGLKASSDVRAEIVELITQLEAKNPTPAPTQALPLLNGKWVLAYVSFVTTPFYPAFA